MGVNSQPIYEDIGWLANRNDMVDEYLSYDTVPNVLIIPTYQQPGMIGT